MMISGDDRNMGSCEDEGELKVSWCICVNVSMRCFVSNVCGCPAGPRASAMGGGC